MSLSGPASTVHRYAAQRELVEALRSANPATYTDRISAQPFYLSESELRHCVQVQEVLVKAAGLLVEHYGDDPAISRAIPLPEKISAVLRAHQKPYQPGSLRADFLYEASGEWKICEINARFPSNAFMLSSLLAETAPRIRGLLEPQARTIPVPAPADFFTQGHSLLVLKGREAGWDVHMLGEELKKQYRPISWCRPENFPAASHFLDAAFSGRVMVELHQDELLSLPPEALLQLHRSNYFNDLRTIMLVHDKRFLTLLSDPQILSRYISAEEAALLSSHVAATRLRAEEGSVREALHNKSQWLLKPNLFGKGEGIVFGDDCSLARWEYLMQAPETGDYVLQRIIRQPDFAVPCEGGPQQMSVVGTLMSFDNQCFGPGIFRASAGRLASISGGGWVLVPAVSDSASARQAFFSH